MEEKIIIIDDQQPQFKQIAKILKDNKHLFYPTYGEYAKFNAFIDPIVQDPQNKSGELPEYFNRENIKPILFIIDVSLNGTPDDKSGKDLYELAISKQYPDTPYIFVTQYSEKEIGTDVPDKAVLIFKKKLDLDLPIKVIEKLLSSKDDRLSEITIDSTYYDEQIMIKKQQLDQLGKWRKLSKLENKLEKKKSKFYFWNLVIESVFRVLIVFSVLFLFYFSILHGLLKMFLKESRITLDITKLNPFEFIEYLFIGPLPLIITFTFYSYYRNVFKPILLNERENTDIKKISSMLDISITKYLFASILFSALIVSILQIITNIFNNPGTGGISEEEAKIALGVGGALLILLFLYIIKIEKNIAKDASKTKTQ